VDIVVVADGRRLVAVEVKLSGKADDGVLQLQRYMEAMAYPVGMLVIGRELLLLRRDFRSGTVEQVGRYDTSGIALLDPSIPAATPRDGAFAFEARVQRWLESLRDGETAATLKEPLRSAIAEWVLPELDRGEVRATGPRPLARVG